MSNKWIQHVKNVQKQHNIGYGLALKVAKESYIKGTGPGYSRPVQVHPSTPRYIPPPTPRPTPYLQQLTTDEFPVFPNYDFDLQDDDYEQLNELKRKYDIERHDFDYFNNFIIACTGCH